MPPAAAGLTGSLSVGDPAPDFTLPDQDENSVALASLAGPTVLFFYPKDDTAGCTAEAKDFAAAAEAFTAAGATVVGISPDNAASHRKFRAKHELGMTLLSDVEKDVLQAYGVWVEKSMYGRRYMGVERTTVLLDANHRIARVWHKVKIPDHAANVLAAVRAL